MNTKLNVSDAVAALDVLLEADSGRFGNFAAWVYDQCPDVHAVHSRMFDLEDEIARLKAELGEAHDQITELEGERDDLEGALDEARDIVIDESEKAAAAKCDPALFRQQWEQSHPECGPFTEIASTVVDTPRRRGPDRKPRKRRARNGGERAVVIGVGNGGEHPQA
jgi:hypothetical protein